MDGYTWLYSEHQVIYAAIPKTKLRLHLLDGKIWGWSYARLNGIRPEAYTSGVEASGLMC